MSPGCCCFPVRCRERRRNRPRRTSADLTSMPSNPPTNTTWVPPDIQDSYIVVETDNVVNTSHSVDDVNDYNRPVDLSVNFNLRYCGMLQSFQGLGHSEEDHQDLILTIGQAQVNGQFKYSEKQNDEVILNLSKYGIKVMEAGGRSSPYLTTRWRHSLLEVIRTVHFVDVTRKTLLAIKLGKFGEDIYDSLLFESDENQAQEICRTMRVLFDAVCSPDE